MVEEGADRAKEGQEKFLRFIKIFEGMEKSIAIGNVLSKKHIEILEKWIKSGDESAVAVFNLFEAITRDKDGLLATLDDLIVEIQGLREDLREVAKAGGFQSVLGSLLGGPGPSSRRRR